MSSKMSGPGLYELLIEAELQQYYNTLKNELKVQNTPQLKYVTDDDLGQIGMSRPEIRRLKKYFQKHFPSNVLAKMKKKLLSRGDNPISISSLSSTTTSSLGKYSRNVAPGRHIIQADSIVIHKTLGSGEFGTVQQGVWTDHDGQRIQVAIKCLSQERMENNPVEFLKEAAIMHAVDHEHVVRLYGVVLDTSALMLVTELAPLRSLLECLKEPSMRPNLSVPTLYDFAIQICTGMEYLESKRLIHRDLAARNILVFSRSKVKISDFGLSRALGVGKDYYQTNFNVNLKLPIAWCAPECINFLRFTSASDVFAFGVTLWEMFSYGFQPWAALTGQQILEAIDEPNYQRLEKPECCPHDIYYQIMLKCWQHDHFARPSFSDLSNSLLPECKPEQVQAIRESEKRERRDHLEFDAGDLITVLEKKCQGSDESSSNMIWKGVLKDGRSGLFDPASTITYLGTSFPTVKKGPFTRNDSRSSSLRKGRISADMISGPQGDFKHTGHVGPDGQFFGDITFLGNKSWVPRQIVSPYKPELSGSETTTDFTTSISRMPHCLSSKTMQEISDIGSSDTAPLLSTAAQMNMDENDHEYHEISDEENEVMGRNRVDMGHSNPALSSKSQSPLDSPRFEKTFDLGGPSLIDEVFGALQHEHPDEAHNVKNELREMARNKKKFATVKPISSADRKTLDHAINLANELASRSMLDLDRPGKSGNSLDDLSPRTPTSPGHKRKFSFILGGGKSERERRNFSQEANSIPDIQSTLTEEAKEAYNSLVEKPSLGALGFLTPSFENKSMSFHFPEKSSCSSKHSEFFELEPSQKEKLPIASTTTEHFPCNNGNSGGLMRKTKPRNLSLPDERMVMNYCEQRDRELNNEEEEVDGNPLRLLRQNKTSNSSGGTNVLPLPPRDRQKSSSISGAPFIAPRHQRKHPLLIPSKISISSTGPPPPPPKPQRQYFRLQQAAESSTNDLPSSSDEYAREKETCSSGNDNSETTTELEKNNQACNTDISNVNLNEVVHGKVEQLHTEGNNNVMMSVIESLRNAKKSAASPPNLNIDKIRLYENFDTAVPDLPDAGFSDEIKGNSIGYTLNNIHTQDNSNCDSKENKPLQRVSTSCNPSVQKTLDVSCSISSVSSNSIQSTKSSSGYCVDPIKVRTVRRILGSSATDEDCQWAIAITDDAAHAVKLLRLKGLLPDSIMIEDVDKVVSVLEMSHWDVARAATFLLESDKKKSTKGISKLKSRTEIPSPRRSELSTTLCNDMFNTSNNNGLGYSSNSTTVNGNSSASEDDVNIRPTRV